MLQAVYRIVVVSKLLYAAIAWWGFTAAADRQRIEGFLRRGVRAGYRRADEPTAAQLQLVEDSDDNLFHRVQYMSGHVLQPLLPVVALTLMQCAIGDMISYYPPDSTHKLTPILLLDNFLKILTDSYFTPHV